MKHIRYAIFSFVLLFVAGMNLRAQDVETYEGMTWCLKKSVALDSARSQGKQVFMVWGTTSCSFTANVRKRLGKGELKAIVDEHYVLWFANATQYNRRSEEMSDYLSTLPGSVTFPAVCVIDLYNTKVGYGLATGSQSERSLLIMLNRYVDNDHIVEEEDTVVNVFVSENHLVVKYANAKELVRVFSVTGLLVDEFKKTDDDMTRNVSEYPKGVLIVTGSSGWVKKVIIR